MSDQQPQATPEQEARVRSLLAEARHTGTLPPEVAQRLDSALARLVADGPRAIDPPPPTGEPSGRPNPPPGPPNWSTQVVDLADRRRRRVTALLAAAAAVVIVGVGGTAVISSLDDKDSSQSDAGGAESVDLGELSRDANPSEAPSAQQEPGIPAPDGGSAPPPEASPLAPSMSVAAFKADALDLRSKAVYRAEAGAVVTGEQLSSDPMFVCEATPTGSGMMLGVTFDGRPAVLAYRDPQGDVQSVDLIQCGTGYILRSTVVPAP